MAKSQTSIAETLPCRLLESGSLPKDCSCTVALSGGADSVALLRILLSLRDSLNITLSAAHVHHGIRGEEADRDAAFCKALCERLEVQLEIVKVDVPTYAKEQKLSLETAARKLRYEALLDKAEGDLIALAHHADDQTETMLFHLLRGCGLRGVCGMRARSGRLIRPLLQVERRELREYLAAIGQDFVEDSSNAEQNASRNRLRARVLPSLTEENPNALKHFATAAELLQTDEDFLNSLAREALEERVRPDGGVDGLYSLHKALRMRCLLFLLDGILPNPSLRLLSELDAALAAKDGTVNLTGNVRAQVCKGVLYITKPAETLCEKLPLRVGENRFFPDKTCIASYWEAGQISWKYHKEYTKSTLDCDKIKGELYFRQWNGTDKLRQSARGCQKSLKKLIGETVPRPLRRKLYVLYDEMGCVYCESVGTADRVQPDANSRRILLLQCEENKTRGEFPKKE